MSTTRQAALLRGVNLGRNRRLAMADLRRLVEGLGYADVQTLLQSGNVVYTSSDPPAETGRRIQAALEEELGLRSDVMVRTGAELAEIVARNPLGDVATVPRHHHVLFLSAEPDPAALAALDPGSFEPERMAAHGRELYVWVPGGSARSPLLTAIGKAKLGVSATARNWNTVTKLADLTAG